MNPAFFSANRQNLQKTLGGGSVIVLAGYGEMQRTNDAAWPFEQEANFWYLSGIEAPDWWLIIEGDKSWAVAPEVDDIKQAFDGSLSNNDAVAVSGVDHVISRDEAMSLLRRIAKKHSLTYTAGHPRLVREHATFNLNPTLNEMQSILERTFQNVESCNRHLSQLRAIKQPLEIEAIQKAIKFTVDSIKNVKRDLSNFRFEYEIEAALSYDMRRNGSDGQAYSPIIAAGSNACTLHYVQNNAKLSRPSLLLMDVGAKYHGYAADISRTYALGKPTAKQRQVHNAVQKAQKDIISYIEPGLQFDVYQSMVQRRMSKALQELKLNPDKVFEYMPHAIGHGLGVDVHDSMAGYDSFQVGMVVTVEPGLYLHEDKIGVRIEDDILVTDTGRKNLSSALPTDI